MEDLINIWNADDELNEDELMNYIKRKSSTAEEHDVEKKMADSPFVNDAVEGLQKIKNKDVSALVEHLNANLHNQLEKKKSKKLKRRIKDLPWLYLSIVFILLIIIISYLVIKRHLDSEKNSPGIPYNKERAQ